MNRQTAHYVFADIHERRTSSQTKGDRRWTPLSAQGATIAGNASLGSGVHLASNPHEQMAGDKTCPKCGSKRFHLYPIPRDREIGYEGRRACAGCLGYDEPSEPLETQGDAQEGRIRLRQRPFEGDGVAPIYEYKPPDDYEWPEVVKEVRIDKDSVLRFMALDFPTKYGRCYEALYINEARGKVKQIAVFRSKSEIFRIGKSITQMVRDMKDKR